MANEEEAQQAATEETPKVDFIEIAGKKFYLPYRDDVVDLSQEERDGLKASIEEHGIIEPIVVNKKNMHVLGGRNRLEIAKELDLPKEKIPIKLLDIKKEEIELEVSMNLASVGRGWSKTARRFTVRKMKERKLGHREIARMLRVSLATVQSDLEKLGLKQVAPSRMQPASEKKPPKPQRGRSRLSKIVTGLDWCGGFARLIDALGMPKKFLTAVQEMTDWLKEAQEAETAEK